MLVKACSHVMVRKLLLKQMRKIALGRRHQLAGAETHLHLRQIKTYAMWLLFVTSKKMTVTATDHAIADRMTMIMEITEDVHPATGTNILKIKNQKSKKALEKSGASLHFLFNCSHTTSN